MLSFNFVPLDPLAPKLTMQLSSGAQIPMTQRLACIDYIIECRIQAATPIKYYFGSLHIEILNYNYNIRETGESCCIDEGNLWSNQQGQNRWSFGGDWGWSYCLWWCQGVSLQWRAECDTAQYPVNQWIEAGEPVMSQHCSTAWVQWSYVKHYRVLILRRKMDWKVNSWEDDGIGSAIK